MRQVDMAVSYRDERLAGLAVLDEAEEAGVVLVLPDAHVVEREEVGARDARDEGDGHEARPLPQIKKKNRWM